MVAVLASLAAKSGAGRIPPPMTNAGLVFAHPVEAGCASASASVISLSCAVVGPGGPAPSSCAAVSSQRLFSSAITFTITVLGAAHPARHRIQALIHRGGVMTEQLGLDRRHATAILLVEHVDMAASRAEL